METREVDHHPRLPARVAQLAVEGQRLVEVFLRLGGLARVLKDVADVAQERRLLTYPFHGELLFRNCLRCWRKRKVEVCLLIG